jgi:ribulose-5-phosphate 4-epimerase/fuculose-1-phosphate aldolase
VGKSVEEAIVNTCDLEIAARYQIMAQSAGNLVLFTQEDMEMLLPYKLETVKQGGDWRSIGTLSSTGRAWEYYKSKVKK